MNATYHCCNVVLPFGSDGTYLGGTLYETRSMRCLCLSDDLDEDCGPSRRRPTAKKHKQTPRIGILNAMTYLCGIVPMELPEMIGI